MSRPHLGDRLSALLDGELPPGEQEGARAHLAGCARCAEELAMVGLARSWVRGLPQVDPPFGFYERMLTDRTVVTSAPFGSTSFGTRPGLRRRVGLAALGAAAAAVTVLGVESPAARPSNPALPQLVRAHATSASAGADLLSKLAPAVVPVSFGR